MTTADVSIILPLKSATHRNFRELFAKAMISIMEQQVPVNEVIIVHTDEELLLETINSFDYKELNVKKVLWEKEPNFCAQINKGVEESTSTWVSFFEFDDEYSAIWFKNFDKYQNIYKDISAFLPIVIDIDEKEVFQGFTNEASFAASFTQEMGFLTNDMLHKYQNFQTSGMVIKKEVFNEIGKFKTNFKLTFSYEFFLRLTHNGYRVMTIPKIGYKHMNLREGSLFWNYKYNDNNKLSEGEAKFWLESAKKEYFFKNERAINYEQTP